VHQITHAARNDVGKSTMCRMCTDTSVTTDKDDSAFEAERYLNRDVTPSRQQHY